MKKYFGIAMVMLGLSVTQAQASEELPTMCESSWTLAFNVMKMRQDNASKSLVESVIYSDAGQSIVDNAYKKAIVPENMRLVVAKSFADNVRGSCELEQQMKKGVAI